MDSLFALILNLKWKNEENVVFYLFLFVVKERLIDAKTKILFKKKKLIGYCHLINKITKMHLKC